MKNNIIRVIAGLAGIPMLFNTLLFLTRPSEAVGSLGMPLLDGLGRSTQIGDFTAFFFGISVLIFMGAYKSKGSWLYAGAMFLGGAAVFRLTAALFHGAEMATEFIAIEFILTVWLCACAYLLDRNVEQSRVE